MHPIEFSQTEHIMQLAPRPKHLPAPPSLASLPRLVSCVCYRTSDDGIQQRIHILYASPLLLKNVFIDDLHVVEGNCRSLILIAM